MKITLKDGSIKEYAEAMSAYDIARDISEGLARAACAVEINGEVKDLRTVVDSDCEMNILTAKDSEGLRTVRHTCSHVLAEAVKRLFPNVKLAIGPSIDEGFYYDFESEPFSREDLDNLEKEMKKISKSNKLIKRLELTKEEALEMFKDDPYKVDIIKNLDDSETISAYKQDDFVDLCRGPHMNTTKDMKYFKLLKVSGAYYKGDSKNKMLQRVYGVCFNTEEDLDAHLKLLEEAKERDHRKIGKDLEIFTNSELVGKGLPLWLPNGGMIRLLLERYIQDKEIKLGYKHVWTPSLGSVDLYKTSGHWDHYKEDMFPVMKLDEEEYVLRPMNCPHHMMIYKNSLHSYRDLPIRLAEVANDFRYEASGAVCGIERTRAFTQNDSHIFCSKEQIKDEFAGVVKLILDTYKDFGFNDYEFRLSLRDKEDKEKYFDDDEMWESAENELRNVLTELNIPFYEAKGEAAFYGPKLDVQVKSAIGHDVTLSTCQLDFLLPERFDLSYIDKDGSKKRPVVIHRAILGSLDRFLAFLLEETKGALPLWLSPVEATIIPVNNEYHLRYAKTIENTLRENNIRVELDDREEKLGYKLREANLKKIPLVIILGDKEKENGNISYRKHGSTETITISIDDFVVLLNNEIKKYR